MNAHEALVERIVQEVSAALRQRTTAETGSAEPQTAGRPTITSRVVTGDLLEKTVNGARSILIGDRSILTPSARDFLRQQGITWDIAAKETDTHNVASRWLAVVVQSTPAVATMLEHHAADWKQLRAADTSEAAGAAVSAICRADADGVVVLSQHPEAVACRANRNANVRAAVVGDILETKAAQQSIGANVLCCDPKQKPFFELRNLLKAMTAGPTQPPPGWRE